MAPSLRTHLNLLVGLLISAAAIYLSLRKIDFESLWTALKSIHYIYLLLVLVCQVLCWVLKGIGWRYLLLPAKKDIQARSTITVLVIGLMVNNLFPAKMGELARAYLMGEREKLSKSLCLSTILVEHLLDILVLSLFLLLLLPSVTLPGWLKNSGAFVGFSALGLITVLFIVMHREERFSRWTGALLSHFPERLREKIQGVLDNILQGIRVVTGRYIYYAFGSLFSMWIMAFLVAYLVLRACALDLPFQAAVMVVVFAAFAKIIPSSPGSIGTFHYVVILVLMSFQVTKEVALGYGIVLHGVTYLMECGVGIVALLAGNISLGRITRQAEEPI